jgi:hypothetical protein
MEITGKKSQSNQKLDHDSPMGFVVSLQQSNVQEKRLNKE